MDYFKYNNRVFKINQMYKHFKGNVYRIKSFSIHTESGEVLVNYTNTEDDGVQYARPLKMFAEKVDVNKYPQSGQAFRFELIEE